MSYESTAEPIKLGLSLRLQAPRGLSAGDDATTCVLPFELVFEQGSSRD